MYSLFRECNVYGFNNLCVNVLFVKVARLRAQDSKIHRMDTEQRFSLYNRDFICVSVQAHTHLWCFIMGGTGNIANS